jgi:hypothetical protein
MRYPRRRLPKAPTVAATTTATTTVVATTAAMTAETPAMTTLSGCIRCAACRHSIADLYASVDKSLQAMEAMKQRLEDLERVVKDDYKLLKRNVRKLFGMVGNMRGKWCNSCRKYD